ncbi:MAG: hypothetical protein Q4D79_09920, partial [Propionibacteriaceae bacterium]|nr:hypothetical protein [Propionibacteriaceae bacterium]
MSVYSGSWRLLVLQVRTGWRSLLLSPIALAGLVAAVAVGVKELYADATKRAGYAATLGSSLASITLNGRAYDLDQLGGVVAYEVGFLG